MNDSVLEFTTGTRITECSTCTGTLPWYDQYRLLLPHEGHCSVHYVASEGSGDAAGQGLPLPVERVPQSAHH